MGNAQRLGTLRTGIVAGLSGGIAEILWVTLYAGLTGSDAAVVARGVTTAAGVGALLPAAPATLGVVVHMALAVALGVGLSFAWRALAADRPGPTNLYTFMLAALIAVWALNFLIVLPIVSPAFVHVVPYAVSLTSKLLFGVAAAESVRDEASFSRRCETHSRQ